MRAVIQRVVEAKVEVDGELISKIDVGLLVLLGVEKEDGQEDIEWLSSKILALRIFDDANGNMNLSLVDQSAEILVVSQFTLLGSTKKGNRPSFIRAAQPAIANSLYEEFMSTVEKKLDRKVKRGIFGADMQVSLINDGPVTLVIDSKIRE